MKTTRHLWTLTAFLVACGGTGDAPDGEVTWYGSAKAVVDTRCATCHTADGVGPFPLTTYEEVRDLAPLVKAAVENGSMPPWQPSDDCTEYQGNIDLTADEKADLLAWIDAGTPEGDPADATTDGPPPGHTFEADFTLQLPEAYTPTREPDDYRCQLVDWPLDAPAFITDFQVIPDQTAIVHHVIAYAIPPQGVEAFRAMDEAEDGPGYTCFGGPNGTGGGPEDRSLESLAEASGAQWVASWVPGASGSGFPDGTGIRVEPGSVLAVQMHYNTLSASPVADRSTLAVQVADSVPNPAVVIPVTDVMWVAGELLGGEGMEIPAGQSDVLHETRIGADSMLFAAARRQLGLTLADGLRIHRVGHHMHALGTWGRSAVEHASGEESCLLEIPDWDFAWQGAYTPVQSVVLGPQDAFTMGCRWDNSAENQMIVDGEPLEPRDVTWGEGTTDEMCLATLFVTAE